MIRIKPEANIYCQIFLDNDSEKENEKGKNMLNKLSLLILIFAMVASTGYSQRGAGMRNGGTISGSVFDDHTKGPVEYANVVIYNLKDSSQVTGGISDKQGKFNIPGVRPGKYYVEVQFMGYEKKRIENVSLTPPSNMSKDLGKIFLKPTAINLENVVVQDKRSPMSYQIDKKVIDVSQIPTAISGNAADVLENVPSVTVDIEGNVSLRGSGSFTVLIDGRPSVMDAQDALQQIPASSIETIEIITNPSAKYDPEGNAGIINIKMKKEKNRGFAGIVNANAGVNDKYGGDFLLEYKTPTLNYNFGLDYNRRYFPGTSLNERQFILSDKTSYINSDGDRERGRISFGIRGGIDFNLSSNDYLSLGGRYGNRDGSNNSTLQYTQWSTLEPQQDFYISNESRSRSGDYYALNLNYQRKFETEGHELDLEFFESHRASDESSISAEIRKGNQFDGKKTTENGPSTRFRGKMDYTLPLGEKQKFEAGSQGEMEISEDATGIYDFDPLVNDYIFQNDFSNTTKYNRRELAVYSIYSNELGNLGFQGGVRGEYTFRTIKLQKTGENFKIDRWDFFPTFHTSFKLAEGSQLMASYTRRIDRPHGWELEPFLTWQDANNVRRGNPALNPEFEDSYELGFQTFFGEVSLSNDFYYKVSHDKVEHIRSVYADNITLTSFANVGTDYSLGSEFMLMFNPVKLWDVNIMGNIYNYKIEGVIGNEAFSRNSFNWNARFNNGFKITTTTQLQFNVRYNSPSVSSQGSWKGYFSSDVAVKQDLLQSLLSLTLQVRDIFGTAKYEFTSEGADFYSYSHYTRESPMVMLNLKLNFNNYKDEEHKQGGGEQNGGMEDQGGFKLAIKIYLTRLSNFFGSLFFKFMLDAGKDLCRRKISKLY